MSSEISSVLGQRRGLPLILGILVVGSLSLLADVWRFPDFGLLYAVGAAVIMLLAARRVGGWLNRSHPVEDIAIGILVLSMVPVLWNHVSSITPFALTVPVIVLALCSSPRILARDMRALSSSVMGALESSRVTGTVMAMLGMAGILWAAMGTIVPPAGMDALNYHLGLGVQYLARGSLTPPDDNVRYLYTQAAEMWSMLAIAFDQTGRTANMVLGMALPLAALAVGMLAGELARARKESARTEELARILGFSAVATTPLCLLMVAHTKPDILAFLLFALGARRLLPATWSPLRAAFLLGGCVAVKLSTVYGVLPALAILFWKLRRQRPRSALACVLVAALPLYWLARNVVFFGVVLPQIDYIAGASSSLGAEYLFRIVRIVASTFFFINQGIDGPYGPVFGALIVASLAFGLSRRNEMAIPAFLTLSAVIFWIVSGGGSHKHASVGLARFLLPSLALGIAAGAAAIAGFMTEDKKRTALPGIVSVVVILAMTVSLIVEMVLIERYQPYPAVVAERLTFDEYLDGWLPGHEVMSAGDRLLPRSARVLAIGEARLFYLNRDAAFDMYTDVPRALTRMHAVEHDLVAFDGWIRSEGFTHIFYSPDVYARNILSGLAPPPSCRRDRKALEDYLAAHGRLLAEDATDHVYLYELTSG